MNDRSDQARRVISASKTVRRVAAGLVIAGVTYTAAMVASAFWWFGYCSTSWLADVGDGTLYVTHKWTADWPSAPLTGWSSGHNALGTEVGTWTWWAWGTPANTFGMSNGYTIWPIGIIMIASGILLGARNWRATSRRRRNLCEQCAYERAGLCDDQACPECGRFPTAVPIGERSPNENRSETSP